MSFSTNNLLSNFLHFYLNLSKRFGVTLHTYNKCSKRLILEESSRYQLVYQMHLYVAFVATSISLGQAAYFHFHADSTTGSTHAATMLHAMFFIMSHFIFCIVNTVHLKKKHEMVNLFNAMIDFEKKFGNHIIVN